MIRNIHLISTTQHDPRVEDDSRSSGQEIAFYGTQRIINKNTAETHPELADAINTLTPYFFEMRCNIIFTRVRRLRNKSFMSRGYGLGFTSVRVSLCFVVSELFPFISASRNFPRNVVASALIPPSSDFAGRPLRG
jgi:hypothetical protein